MAYENAKATMERTHALMDNFETAVEHFIDTDYGPELDGEKKIAFAAFEDQCDMVLHMMTLGRVPGADMSIWPDLKVREAVLVDRLVKLRLRLSDAKHPDHVGAILRRTYRAVVGR